MLPHAHPAHSIGMNLDTLKIVAADRAGKIEQNPVWIRSRLKRWLDGSTERDFHAQIVSLSRRGHTLYRRCSRSVLGRGARHQEY